MSEHELKTWPLPFNQLWLGNKTHEIRKADRDFALWDVLHLREWNPKDEMYTGRWIRAEVTYITRGGEWDIPVGLTVMSVRTIQQGNGRATP